MEMPTSPSHKQAWHSLSFRHAAFMDPNIMAAHWYQNQMDQLYRLERDNYSTELQAYLAQVRRLMLAAPPVIPRVYSEGHPLMPPTLPATSSPAAPSPPWLPQLSKLQEVTTPTTTTFKPKQPKASPKAKEEKDKVHRCHHTDCNYATDRRSNLNRHIVAMHDRRLSRSSHFCCGIHFDNKAKQRLHARSVHSQGYQCNLRDCGKRFQRKTLLDRHLATHDPSLRRHECNTCGYKTANKSNLHRHDEKHK